ncbi:putative selenocysteine lyase [Halobacteriovorax marinus SJ]|uniref:Probable cysteine desulfurase n=1 Tax=Halobacteriovorax marinus (strain ATCC BAA-682 / DSM 15412 / SJ) TaxID=862908 RepID=E1X0I0_HALMS|nr:cysteine desulfurase [Halobacteriovorax marinus]CBW28006.1 putative selenocysteine lyase [Halobacteriovorax marinus SJ]
MKFDPMKIREDFPVYKNNKEFLYFDNACTSLRPQQVISAMNEYYEEHPSCHNRALHLFGVKTTKKYEDSRKTIAKFINAQSEREIVFTRNTTEAINIIAKGINWQVGDRILTTEMEHNSNLLPWQFLTKEKGVELNHISLNKDFDINLEDFERELSEKKYRLVSLHHTSNVTGSSLSVAPLVRMAKKYGALVLLDCAQAMTTSKIDVQELDVDFIAFSFHKCFGPSGVGALFGKESILSSLTPMLYGGETVIDSTYDSCTFSDIPFRFEAGLQNYSGVIGTKACIEYIESIGIQNIKSHLTHLNSILTEFLLSEERVQIIGPRDANLRGGIINFSVEGLDLGQISLVLDKSHRIMVRSGVHCCHSWYHEKELKPSLRVSLGPYNTEDEVLKFIEVIKPIIRYF